MVNEQELNLIHHLYMEETEHNNTKIVSIHEVIDYEYLIVNNDGSFYLVDTCAQCCSEIVEVWRAD